MFPLIVDTLDDRSLDHVVTFLFMCTLQLSPTYAISAIVLGWSSQLWRAEGYAVQASLASCWLSTLPPSYHSAGVQTSTAMTHCLYDCLTCEPHLMLLAHYTSPRQLWNNSGCAMSHAFVHMEASMSLCGRSTKVDLKWTTHRKLLMPQNHKWFKWCHQAWTIHS